MLPKPPVDVEAVVHGIRDASYICLVTLILIVSNQRFISCKMLLIFLQKDIRSYIDFQCRVGVILDTILDLASSSLLRRMSFFPPISLAFTVLLTTRFSIRRSFRRDSLQNRYLSIILAV